MKKVMFILILLFSVNLFAKILECRLYSDTKKGINIDVYNNQVIDSINNVYEKIGSKDGVNIFRGFDKKYNKNFVWMIKNESNNFNGVSSFDAVVMEDIENGLKTRMICFDKNEIDTYRQK